MHHRRIKLLFIRLLLYNSIIHHTYNVFFLLNLQVIWQTCATVNVRYFPWGKLGWEGPGTLLAMGLPEIKGGLGSGAWGQRGIVHRSHYHHPSQSTLHPLHLNPPCGSVQTLMYSRMTHTHAMSLQHGGGFNSIDTAYNAWIYKWNISGPPSFFFFPQHSHSSRHLELKHKHSAVQKYLDSRKLSVVLAL